MLLRVWTELPSGKFLNLFAKVIHTDGDTMTIQYLSPTEDKDHGRIIFRYEDQTYDIQDDSVTEYLGTDNEFDIGFVLVENGFVKEDSDSDYIPSSEEDDADDDDDDDDVDDDEEFNFLDQE